MSMKPIYVEAPGSKQTTIQLEMPAHCTIRDINTFLCSSVCGEAQTVNNPHQAAYFAFLIDQMKVGIQAIKAKKDNPIQLGYSVYDNVFIITLSFVSDNASFRMIAKMMAEKCFLKNVKPAIQMIAQVDKEFVKQHGRELIEDAIKFQQRGVSIYVMSKMPKGKFEGGKDAFGTKVITTRFNDTAAKLDIPSKSPIPNKPVELDPEIYTNISVDIITMPPVFQALLLAALNGQQVEYVVLKRELKVKQKDFTNPGKEVCIKFMKERLAFTKEGKMKPYSALSSDQKRATSEKDYNAKQDLKLQKKNMGLIQTLSQSGGVPMDLLVSMRKPLESHVFNPPAIEKIKKILDKLVKNK